MNTLFISTYNDNVILGLLENGKEKDLINIESEKSHSVVLIPSLEEILKKNNLEVQNINEIIVVNGPGSFTGIRLGVTVAKTIAFTLNIPIKVISSIEMIGASCITKNNVVTISDKKGKYVGRFVDNKLVDEIVYLSNNEYAEKDFSDSYVITETLVNLNKIYEYCRNIKTTTPHNVNAIYIKGIEALNGR